MKHYGVEFLDGGQNWQPIESFHPGGVISIDSSERLTLQEAELRLLRLQNQHPHWKFRIQEYDS